MTCIVGIKEKDWVVMAADLRGADSGSGHMTQRQKSKIITKQFIDSYRGSTYTPILIGSSGSFRVLDLLNSVNCILPDCDCEDYEDYVIDKVIPSLQDLLSKNGLLKSINGVIETECMYLIAIRNRLFSVHGDFQVWEPHEYYAIGSGFAYALGSLYSTAGQPIHERCRLAMESASQYCGFVSSNHTLCSTRSEK